MNKDHATSYRVRVFALWDKRLGRILATYAHLVPRLMKRELCFSTPPPQILFYLRHLFVPIIWTIWIPISLCTNIILENRFLMFNQATCFDINYLIFRFLQTLRTHWGRWYNLYYCGWNRYFLPIRRKMTTNLCGVTSLKMQDLQTCLCTKYSGVSYSLAKMKPRFLINFSYIFVKLDRICVLGICKFDNLHCPCINKQWQNTRTFHNIKTRSLFSSIFPLFPTVVSNVGRCLSMFATRLFWLFRAPKLQVASPHFQCCDRREHKLFTA
jgi:hypothetical protein